MGKSVLPQEMIFPPASPPRRFYVARNRPAITTGIDSNGNGNGKDERWRIKQLIDVLIIQLLFNNNNNNNNNNSVLTTATASATAKRGIDSRSSPVRRICCYRYTSYFTTNYTVSRGTEVTIKGNNGNEWHRQRINS